MQKAYRIALTPQALALLSAIPDRRIQQSLRDKIRCLSQDPEKQGKPLLGELMGYRSIRAIGQRYRILYRIEPRENLIIVVALGLRKERSRSDIYSLAKKLIRLKLISPKTNK